jgi:polyisoprenoid-binding protein YceI
MKNKIIAVVMMALPAMSVAQTKWDIDNAHSQVMFNVSHLVISEVTGHFKTFSGNITASNPDFTDARIDFQIDIASINTDNQMRDDHLKSDDFFNAGKFPKMVFKGKELKKVSGNKYKLTGDLTIRDVTKTVTLDVTYSGTVKDPWGNTKAGFKIKGSVNRFDYNLKWNTLTEAGGAVVGPEVEIVCNLQLSQAK